MFNRSISQEIKKGGSKRYSQSFALRESGHHVMLVDVYEGILMNITSHHITIYFNIPQLYGILNGKQELLMNIVNTVPLDEVLS